MRSFLRSLPLLLIAAGLFAIAATATADTPRRFWVTTRDKTNWLSPGETDFLAIRCPRIAPVRLSGGFAGEVDILASDPYGMEERHGYLAGQWRVVAYNPHDNGRRFMGYVVCTTH
jgi:hypothetical protein